MQSGPYLLLLLLGIALLYAGLAILSAWLFQRKSAVHPIRNGFISAGIPGFAFILYGFIQSPPLNEWGMNQHEGPQILVFLIIAIVSIALFLLIGLPACILFCKKLAKRNSSLDSVVIIKDLAKSLKNKINSDDHNSPSP